MPSVKIHCEISKERTGNEFKELHEWIDEPQAYLGANHRIERHSFHEAYKEFIEKKWGNKAVVEWLFHIALDNLETSTKFADKAYCLSYAGIEVNFKDGEIISCKFRRDYSDGKSSITEYKRE